MIAPPFYREAIQQDELSPPIGGMPQFTLNKAVILQTNCSLDRPDIQWP